MQTQPHYPFFTRWQQIYFVGYFAPDCSVRFKQADSACGAAIAWDTMERRPNFLGTDDFAGEQVIPEADFRAALLVAENELADFMAVHLPLPATVYATGTQTAAIRTLISHPLISRRIKTSTLLVLDKLTTTDAAEYIARLTALIAELEGPLGYAVTGEAFLIGTKAA